MSTDTTTHTDTATTETAGTGPGSAVADETAVADTPAPEAPAGEAAEDQGDAAVDPDQDVEDQGDAGDGPGREAAKYRRRLREAETERDRLAEQVVSLQRAEVERLAMAGDLRPAALWASGAELAGLLGDDGTVDAAKVTAAIEAAREQLGIPKPPVGPRVPREGRSLGRPPKPSGKEAMIATVMGRDALDG